MVRLSSDPFGTGYHSLELSHFKTGYRHVSASAHHILIQMSQAELYELEKTIRAMRKRGASMPVPGKKNSSVGTSTG